MKLRDAAWFAVGMLYVAAAWLLFAIPAIILFVIWHDIHAAWN